MPIVPIVDIRRAAWRDTAENEGSAVTAATRAFCAAAQCPRATKAYLFRGHSNSYDLVQRVT